MDDAQVLALLAGQLHAGMSRDLAQDRAVTILVWAKTDGLAEVYRRVRLAAVAQTATTEPRGEDGPARNACECPDCKDPINCVMTRAD